MAKDKSSNNGKGLKVFATLLLLIALGCIGAGVYLYMNQETVQEPVEEEVETPAEPESIELDIASQEVVTLFAELAFNEISLPGADDTIKDFYEVKTEVNDDLKLYLALMANDKVKNFEAGQTVSVPTSELEQSITNMFEAPRAEDYKNMNLGEGKVATFDANANAYTISLVGEIPDDSKYHGELYSAVKSDNKIIITVKVYYASLEQGDNGPVYKVYTNSKKEKAVSEEAYKELPAVSSLTVDDLDTYEFEFSQIDESYKLTSFKKVEK